MKKQYDISVILPVYNNVQYLEECLDSVLAEEKLSIEIVAIDDGSTDGSEQILDDYAGKYENIRVFHQENSGVSVARNLGLKKANGEYICYLDSDDRYCPGVLEKGLALCSEKKLDVLFFTYENFFENEIAAGESAHAKKRISEGTHLRSGNASFIQNTAGIPSKCISADGSTRFPSEESVFF